MAHEDQEEENEERRGLQAARNRRGARIIKRRALHKLDDWTKVGRHHPVPENVTEEVEPGFYQLRRELIDHYYYMFKNRREELEWLN